jgi:hypothetical protein
VVPKLFRRCLISVNQCLPVGRFISGSKAGAFALRSYPSLDLAHDPIQIRIPSSKFPRDEIPAALRNLLPVHQHIELTGASRPQHRLDPDPFLDEGHETRDLSSIVHSSRAMHNFNPHFVFSVSLNPPSPCLPKTPKGLHGGISKNSHPEGLLAEREGFEPSVLRRVRLLFRQLP